MKAIFRFAVIVSLMFWQGGFMFYGGVVVPVGGRVLGSHTQQGFITQSVTNYLNGAGLLCLTLWASSLWYERRDGVSKLEWANLAFGALLLIGIFAIHLMTDRILDAETTTVIDHVRFEQLHKIYIETSKVQWFSSLFMLFLAMCRWSAAVR